MADRLLTQGHFSSMCELRRLRGLTLFCLLLLAPVRTENYSLFNERGKKMEWLLEQNLLFQGAVMHGMLRI